MAEHDGGTAPASGTRSWWLDRPGSVRRVVLAVYAICAALLLVDPLVHKHGPFPIEHVFGFYAWFGFVACVGLVLAAKVLRLIIMRPEDYYDR